MAHGIVASKLLIDIPEGNISNAQGLIDAAWRARREDAERETK